MTLSLRLNVSRDNLKHTNNLNNKKNLSNTKTQLKNIFVAEKEQINISFCTITTDENFNCTNFWSFFYDEMMKILRAKCT